MMQHSPGPWRVEKSHDLWMEIRAGHGLVADCVAPRNANLIAAAPDLLEACEAALIGAKHEACKYRGKIEESPEPTFHCCDWSSVVDLLEKAIAKAKGR
jgi:hypothetical protein